jgi:hypothetical protein
MSAGAVGGGGAADPSAAAHWYGAARGRKAPAR